MGLTVDTLKAAAPRLATAAQAAEGELNTLDGQLGDGDLGITVATGWTEVAKEAADMPDDVGLALLAAAKAFQRVSSSSYGTLTATALMAAAKQAKGQTDVSWSEIGSLVAAGRDAMMARGKGALGDKSVLDALDAIAKAIDGLDDPAAIHDAAANAMSDALQAFRDRPNKLGRARMFGEKTIGLDDPGMLAVQRLVAALGAD
ncbi:DAK2 domain-containing protein [Bauldia sp.]|uniref:DAK2 domain-containing protein n=1 Tax=Bauldia sp. TaxID=2575872 RepID=UPI003BAA99EE